MAKIERAEARARACLGAPTEDLLAMLADHAQPEHVPSAPAERWPPQVLRALQALCVHLPFYGTVSATAIFWDGAERIERYFFADGPPCTTPFRDVTSLLAR